MVMKTIYPDPFSPRNNKVSLDELVRILVLIASPPNLRHKPQPGDCQDRHFDAWFDGGAIVMPTGGMSEYWFDDGIWVGWAGLAPRLGIKIKWPDGRAVTLNQGSDHADCAKDVPSSTIKIDPKQIGHYDINGVLGKGARGVVYEGFDRMSRSRVAIKAMRKNAFDADTTVKEYYATWFSREARVVARLNHANIVQVLDFGEEGDIAYIVMEFIEGRELKSFFDANERFEIKEAVRIMCELCDALHFAHEADIIHRDVKPANVMIDVQGCVKLTDFGLACFTNADIDKNDSEKTGAMIGTPAYMSPEAITGAETDRRTDIFSAGIILYQLLTGERLFSGPSVWTTAQMILEDDPAPPSSINKTISPLFDAVVRKALAKKAENRYQTAHELGLALRAALA